jgi:hypothetical protein
MKFSRLTKKTFVFLIVLTGITLSFVWSTKVKTITKYDAFYYLMLSEKIHNKGIFNFYDDAKPYGYPFLIEIINTLTKPLFPKLSLVDAICYFQFFLHLLTSITSVYIYKNIAKKNKSTKIQLLIFLLIQLNPLLIGSSKQILSETATTFLMTAFFYSVIQKNSLKYFFISLFISLAIVFKAFTLSWSIFTFTLVLIFYLIRNFRSLKSLLKLNLPKFNPVLLQVIIPFIIIVGVQFYNTYQNENHISLMPQNYQNVSKLHMSLSTYVYKYETYTGDNPRIPPTLYYESRDLQKIFESCLSKKNHILCRIENPIKSIYVYIIKLTALFQNYEWSTYRNNLKNTVSFVFLFGQVMFMFFVLTNYYYISTFIKEKLTTKNITIICVNTYVILYAIFSLPESRFIYPILPMLTLLTIEKISNTKWIYNKNNLYLKVILLTIILYFYVGIMVNSSLLTKL